VAKLDSYGASDVGRRRQLNEDSLVMDQDSGLFIVADGMGGHNAGEIASKLAAETVMNFIRRAKEEEEITWPYGVDPKLSIDANRLRTAIMLANKRVWKEADKRQDYTGMGTTIVAAVVGDDSITFAGAGDSRLYRIRGEEIVQLTIDDSWVQVAIDEGVLDPGEAEHHPMRNIITKAIGAKENIEIPVFEEQLEDGDFFVLCSDGLHGMINDEEILRIVLESGNTLETCVKKLIQAANDNGGKDNVTVLLMRHHE
jgi:serine/threonine protein phosphatase PrpC